MTNTTREELLVRIRVLEQQLLVANTDLAMFDALPENNQFDDYETACAKTHGKLLCQAEEDCEGSYNYGDHEYFQEFIVDGKHYMGKLSVEYNRHDKTYYYVDGHEFTATEII